MAQTYVDPLTNVEYYGYSDGTADASVGIDDFWFEPCPDGTVIHHADFWSVGCGILHGDINILDHFTLNEKEYTVTSIGHAGFASTPITSVSIPETVTNIKSRAFWNCTALTEVVLPSSVTSIGYASFSCPQLTEVVSYIEEPFPTNGFDDVMGQATLHVPAGTREKYLAAGWNFSEIVEMDGEEQPVHDLAERTLPVEPDFGPGQLDVSQFELTPVDFALGDCYVIYNVGAQAYFSEGNLWGAQASVSATTPLLVRFTLPEGRTLDDAALLFNDYSNLKNKWKLVFFDQNAEVYVDRGSQPDIYWQVVAGSGEKTYRLQASPLNPTYTPAAYGGFLGLDVAGDAGNTALSPFLTEGEGHHIDWQFFAVSEWTGYFKAKAVYDMAMKLKELIATAEAEGVSVAAAVAVYNDMSATVEQLQAAFDALTAAMVNNIGNGTPDKPGNATVVIANPNFDDASAAGWSGTTPNMVGSGAHGPANVAEHYNTTFDTYQDLSGLPAGVYALRAKTAFRGSWNDYLKGTPATARLYATVGDEDSEMPFNNIWSCLNTEPMAGATEFGTTAYENTTALNGVAYHSPNDPSAFRLYAERGFYDTTLFFEVTGDKARIGVRNPQKCGDGCDNWAIFDTFTLTYYGNEPGSYQKWLELAVPAVVPTEDDVYSTAYWDAYQEALCREVTGKAETLEAIELLKVRMAELQANIQAWKSYIEIVTVLSGRVEEYLDYPDLWLMEGAKAARDYVETTYPQYLSARELTTAQLEEEYAKVETLLSDFMRDLHGFVTTAVDGLEKKHDGNGIRYTIDGRRARSEQRGIYIRDGRKVLK